MPRKTSEQTKPKPLTPSETEEPRRFTPASYRSRRKRRKAEKGISRTPVTNSFVIFGRAIKMLRNHWEVFGGIVLVYAIINIVLVGGISGSAELQQMKDSIGSVFTGQANALNTGLTLFGFLVVSGTGVASGVASAYQTLLLVIISLSIVWALRQLYAGNKIRIRDAFYNSSYPLVQLLLVLLMVTVHLVPAVFGTFLVTTLALGDILTVGWQQALAAFVGFLFIVWSAYLLCASLFAAYIVTLPDMTPLKALRSAKDIVRYRRAMVLRKLLFLPFALLIVSAIIMVPLAILYTPAATAVFFVLTILGVPMIHSYMYSLYRELIK